MFPSLTVDNKVSIKTARASVVTMLAAPTGGNFNRVFHNQCRQLVESTASVMYIYFSRSMNLAARYLKRFFGKGW
jgi:hypothetical protein